MYKRSAHVLFIDADGLCRSHMAAGWANHLGGGRISARSAEIEPHGMNPHAMSVMREVGIDLPNPPLPCLTPGMLAWADLVVTVCLRAEERCPTLPAGARKRHWPLGNPGQAGGDEGRVMQVWRLVRDDIRGRVEGMIGGMKMLERMDTGEA
ncbi:MAG: arsenate reductase ArsC [Acidiferrobacterales bacterium]